MLLDLIKPDPVTGQMIAGGFARGYVKTQIELIQDYKVAGDVVDKLGWANNPQVVAQWQAETGGVGDMRRWGAQRIINATEVGHRRGLEHPRNHLHLARSRHVEGDRQPAARSPISTAACASAPTAPAAPPTGTASRPKRRARRWPRPKPPSRSSCRTMASSCRPAAPRRKAAKLAGLQAALVSLQGNARRGAVPAASTSPVLDQLKLQVTTLNDQIEQAAEKLGTAAPELQGARSAREAGAEAAGAGKRLGACRRSPRSAVRRGSRSRQLQIRI